ncbi:hypothetical protein AAS23_gp43 [Pantoea phage vB_PagS_AAS23]|uniref:Uncharacterized protein n=1 Tax=Pantoea phage vB_PagS_AAS23 TaxID=2499073 RepID=A0A3S9U7T0_9CAUD|nr:hypothetical protein HOU93_gp43 [Pantoea phage vB_PagS_AAS23]AZS06356.1 hypothetical protein AAS23_gp43 [Pantoea phage vB_PagS_AAS23]
MKLITATRVGGLFAFASYCLCVYHPDKIDSLLITAILRLV